MKLHYKICVIPCLQSLVLIDDQRNNFNNKAVILQRLTLTTLISMETGKVVATFTSLVNIFPNF